MSKRVMKQLAVAIACIGAPTFIAGSLVRAAETRPLYQVTRTISLGAPDRWDYVAFDPASEHVYVAHGDEVTVVDANDGAIVGHVSGIPGGTHGIAIDGRSGRGYTDDGEKGEAVAFNLQTLQVEKHIKADPDADAVTFDPASHHVFVVNGDTGTLTVIDPASNQAIATITQQGALEFAVPDSSGNLYVNGAERREVVRINTSSNKVTARWPVPQCARPHGLAIDVRTQRLFISCVNNRLVVLDAASGKAVASLPIGSGTDAAAFDPVRKLVFSSNGRDGTLSIIREVDANSFIPLATVKTAVTARTMALNPKTGRLFIATAEASESPAEGVGHIAVIPGSLKLLFMDPVD
jgi:YVTN family beta-propeller protein